MVIAARMMEMYGMNTLKMKTIAVYTQARAIMLLDGRRLTARETLPPEASTPRPAHCCTAHAITPRVNSTLDEAAALEKFSGSIVTSW